MPAVMSAAAAATSCGFTSGCGSGRTSGLRRRVQADVAVDDIFRCWNTTRRTFRISQSLIESDCRFLPVDGEARKFPAPASSSCNESSTDNQYHQHIYKVEWQAVKGNALMHFAVRQVGLGFVYTGYADGRVATRASSPWRNRATV